MYNWKNNNWCKADNSPIQNKELIKTYYDLTCQGYKLDIRWVKGHNNNQWNELADKLATGKYKTKGD